MMTYKLNPKVARIKSGIKLIFPDGSKKRYTSGKEVADDEFRKRYNISELKAVDSLMEISLTEQGVPIVNWTGEENVSFF